MEDGEINSDEPKAKMARRDSDEDSLSSSASTDSRLSRKSSIVSDKSDSREALGLGENHKITLKYDQYSDRYERIFNNPSFL